MANQPPVPELIPEPSNDPNEPGYVPASTEIQNADQLNEMQEFIASVHGEAKALDSRNVTDSQFTKGLTFDAKKTITDLRREVHTGAPVPVNQQNPPPIPPGIIPPMPVNHVQPPTPTVSQGDSLILKAEIDSLKAEVSEIKKLYNEFFKLKTVKGEWVITANSKETKAPSVAKAWNTLNKLLKNKTNHITIKYTEKSE